MENNIIEFKMVYCVKLAWSELAAIKLLKKSGIIPDDFNQENDILIAENAAEHGIVRL